ncbi:Uncharacterised protein [Burkholderia pseudomallei]|nr:Uncharacterised protein [Burkholderia pseudomallei]CAJ6697420.1 Uncharacterised protein [Burkholderia pseudomallei]
MGLQIKVMEPRYRPGRQGEDAAREIVRKRHPAAQSAYSEDGAIVFDPETGEQLGKATLGDWAVEMAWQDAAAGLS